MGSQIVKFTCQAASYTNARGTYTRGFEIVLPDGDPRVREFRGNRAFKEQVLTSAAVIPTPEIETASPEGSKVNGVAGNELDGLVDTGLIPIIAEAGLTTRESILDAGFEGLLEIGLSEPAAQKILKAVEEASPYDPFEELDGKVVKLLAEHNLTKAEDILEAGENGLIKIKGIGRVTAQAILEAFKKASAASKEE